MKVWYTMLMKLKNKLKGIFILLFLFFFTLIPLTYAKENFFIEGKKLFDLKKYDESKFLFQRSIVYDPKKTESYIYLSKIFSAEDNEIEEKKNIKTALLLDPKNEEALLILINIELKRSNISEVKKLKNRFQNACSSLCDKISNIDKKLSNIEAKDESW